MEDKRVRWGLCRRRLCPVPTWRGWLLLVLACLLLALGVLRGAYPFLAVSRPLPGGVLVIEGWAPDFVFEGAVAEFNRGHYDRVFVTGGGLEHGAALAGYKTYAELGAAMLAKLGLDTNLVQGVPCPVVPQDRTYASALALKRWWRAHGVSPSKVNLITVGPHARRSRLLFEHALGKETAVGIVAFPPNDFDPARWWRSSQGFRVVTGEIIAYIYARLLSWRFRTG